MYFKSLFTALVVTMLAACQEDHGDTSFSLQSALSDIVVTCNDLSKPRMGKLFWVTPALDGTGILLVSKSNESNEYILSLTSHFHERALETRKIECTKL